MSSLVWSARIAERVDPLVAGPEPVERVVIPVLHLVGALDPERDVGGLLVEGDHDAAHARVDPLLAVITQVPCGPPLARRRPETMSRFCLGRDLPGDDDEAGAVTTSRRHAG